MPLNISGGLSDDRDSIQAQIDAAAAAVEAAQQGGIYAGMGVNEQGVGPGGSGVNIGGHLIGGMAPGERSIGSQEFSQQIAGPDSQLGPIAELDVRRRLVRRPRQGQDQPQQGTPPVWTPPWQPGQPGQPGLSPGAPYGNQVVDFMDPRHLWQYDPYLGVSTRTQPMNYFSQPWDVQASQSGLPPRGWNPRNQGNQGMTLADLYQRFFSRS